LVLLVVSVHTGRLNLRHTLKGITQFSQIACAVFPKHDQMRNTVIHIPTTSGSDKVQCLIVVLIFHQLSRGCILKHHGDDLCFLYDLPNGMTLAQEIIVNLVFSITKILDIEDNELHVNFLHVAFGSQSQLRIMSDLTRSDTN
jgi:hypothetical protein